jgi:hypothetical protein
MSQIVSQFDLGIITITENWDLIVGPSASGSAPRLSSIDQEYIVSFIDLTKVKSFTTFEYQSIGETDQRFLKNYYRISRNGTSWTNWLELDYEITNFPQFDPLDKMYIDIKFVRSGENENGEIILSSFKIVGDLLQDINDGTVLVGANSESVIEPPFIFKVFRIDDFEIISSSSLTGVDLKWRFSQDNSRTWSSWEVLSKENISTKRINPIRFFQVQYLITNNTSSSIKIQDINLIGDFQNVTLDYQKTNLYGIRDCCQSNILGTSNGVLDANGNLVPNATGVLDSQSCTTGNILKPLTADDKAKLYNPYQQSQAINLLNKLSNDAMEVFGWRVKYFVTDPDGKGIDYTLHEFQLYNIVCEEEIKVAVENNQFPDNQIQMNQFDLNLFDSFEIHITKESFKSVFGVQRRPSKEDLVYFCDINRMYIVEHSQQFRNFNNAAVYYKVVLKKYNKSLNVKPGSKAIDDRLKELTKNSTIDELFGVENKQDKAAVANKPQNQPLTRDPIRLEYKSEIVKELIENSTTIVSKQHYDFSNLLYNNFTAVTQSVAGVTYKSLNTSLKVSDNISYFAWFNINNYIQDETYNLFNNYDESTSSGWKLNLRNDNITLNLNSDTYTFSFTGATNSVDDIFENIWYCYLVNIDQRNRKITNYLYKRNVDYDEEESSRDLSSTVLKLVYSSQLSMNPIVFDLVGVDAKIMISDMKITNIRLFSEIIPVTEHNKILNQYIIADDAKYLIFADNANSKLTLPYFPYHN